MLEGAGRCPLLEVNGLEGARRSLEGIEGFGRSIFINRRSVMDPMEPRCLITAIYGPLPLEVDLEGPFLPTQIMGL